MRFWGCAFATAVRVALGQAKGPTPLILQVSIRRNAAPGSAPFIMTRKQCTLAIESDGADEIFTPVGVDPDTAIAEEGLRPSR